QVAGPRIPSSSASGAEITKVRCCGARRVDRGAYIEFYAQPARATERAASTARARWKYCGGGLPRSIRATAPSKLRAGIILWLPRHKAIPAVCIIQVILLTRSIKLQARLRR